VDRREGLDRCAEQNHSTPPEFEHRTVQYVASLYLLRCPGPYVVLLTAETLKVGYMENPALISLYCSFRIPYQSVLWFKCVKDPYTLS